MIEDRAPMAATPAKELIEVKDLPENRLITSLFLRELTTSGEAVLRMLSHIGHRGERGERASRKADCRVWHERDSMLNDHGAVGFGPSLGQDSSGSANRRADQRHLSVFRVGKLITSAGQELCLVRNISSGGLMAHIYSPHHMGEHVAIELKAGSTVSGKIVWSRDKKIGVQFDDKVEVAEVLAPQPNDDEADFIARAPRLDIKRRGRLRVGAHYQLIETQDISQGGAKFAPAGDAKTGDEVVLLLDGLPPLSGIVRWRHGDAAGITFKTSIPFEQLAQWIPQQR